MNYVGLEASDAADDVVVTATFAENETGATLSSTGRVTVVRVELEADKIAPQNPSMNRHVFGVCELVHLRQMPAAAAIDWSAHGASHIIFWNDWKSFYCHALAESSVVRASLGGATLDIRFDVVVPSVVCRGAEWDGVSGTVGRAGDVCMRLALYVEPLYVSFEGLPMQEIVDDSQSGCHDGYFDDQSKGGSWSHDYASGAGDWHIVSSNAYWFTDNAGVVEYVRPWRDGQKTWAIPIGWSRPWNRTLEAQIVPNPTTQEFQIDTDGTVSVRKYNHEIRRSVDNHVWLDGVRVDR